MFVGYPDHYKNESQSDGKFFENKDQNEINRPVLLPEAPSPALDDKTSAPTIIKNVISINSLYDENFFSLGFYKV